MKYIKPKIQIVDENDKLIGHKDRNKVNYEKDIYRSTTLWVENSQGEVLIAQRKFTKDKDPGLWGPAVAGTVDEGETYESNIYKEAGEEIGLVNTKFQFKIKIRKDNPRKQFVQIYFAKVDKDINDFKIQEEEVEQITWIPKDKLAIDIKNHLEKYVTVMPILMDLFK